MNNKKIKLKINHVEFVILDNHLNYYRVVWIRTKDKLYSNNYWEVHLFKNGIEHEFCFPTNQSANMSNSIYFIHRIDNK